MRLAHYTPVLAALLLGGCFQDPEPRGGSTSETGDGDGDPGDGDGDTGDGDGDGDGDPGDGDGDTGDGDGDPGDGDGDGDGDPAACTDGPYAVSYSGPLTLPAGANPQGVALGYVNMDANLDVVSSSRDEHRIRTFLGSGNGSFDVPIITELGSMPFPGVLRGGAIADSAFDIVTLGLDNGGGTIIARLRGDGQGGFGDYEANPFVTNQFVLGLATGDNALDVITASGGVLTVFPATVGQESYSFNPIISAGPWPSGGLVAAGDWDGDADLDVAVATFGALYVGLGNGAAEYAFAPPIPYMGGPSDIAAGDIDGDGDLDIVLVTAGGGSDAGHVFRGQGDGTFGPDTVITAPSGPAAVGLSDIDKDGMADLAIVGGQTMAVYLSTGDGFGPVMQLNCGLNPRQIAMGDVNGDCVDDVVTVSISAQQVCVMMSDPP
ncbi:hypothetical protein ENSA7_37180 [Enhygromyxa salina]|uniref:FG-GAP repeat protein n=2 Tax=Enhygromyxa salina TaxID=215803 RepID=A0A2S9YNA8_9BACT|nr:hypothetical protein ENSA7_37180 [Enhygromyxa salina]